ncbi:MAG: histidine phosphatase family protein [Nitrosomonadales bacterium]|nr:MAG: histidine phosphatase family protein [Nitrosomonadales bacterium]
MELILWRHAEAEDSLPDMGRVLTAKGHRQAEKMAAWLKTRLPDDARVLVSPAKRTQQTAAALSKDFTTVKDINTGASVDEVLTAAGWPNADGAVLIVGHQPTLGAVAARLLAGQDTSWSVKKGAVWWLSVRQTEVILRAVVSPDLL